MKSFGVRLAAGAVTILFGAYAAALAQKDKQDSSNSWNAESPSQGEPALPIASGEEASWLTPPASQLSEQERALTMSDAKPVTSSQAGEASPVQLVQHTEPAEATPSDAPGFDPSVLPPSLGAPEASETNDPTSAATATLAQPSWMVPPTAATDSDAAGTDAAGNAAMSMTFPTPGVTADGAAVSGESAPTTQGVATPGMEFSVPETGASEKLASDPSVADPALQQFEAAAVAPTTDTSNPFQSPDAPSIAVPADAQTTDLATANQGPTNLLRGGDSNANTLRGSEPITEAAVDATVASATVAGATDAGAGVAGAGVAGAAVAGAAIAGVAVADAAAAQAALSNEVGPGMTFAADPPPQYGTALSTGPAATSTGAATLATPTISQTEGFPNPTTGAIAASEVTAPSLANPAIPVQPSVGSPQSLAAQPLPSQSTFAEQPPAQQTYDTTAGYPNPEAPTIAAAAGSPNMDRVANTPQAINAMPAGYQMQPTGMTPPTAAMAINPNATTDAPGERRLEGAQTPSVIIQKRAPAEVKVGKPASFVIHVQNVGTVEALDVEVHDRIPAGMRLIDASPAPLQQGNLLLWQLGVMPAGDERTVTMQLVPEQEGELGSVARVSFEAAASVRTIATRPELKIVQRAPETVLIGQQLEIELEVSNPGTGEAANVVLQEDVPEGLEHPKGRQLDNALGSLAPGEVRNQLLRLRAVAPGVIQNTIRLTGEDGLTAEHTVAVQVVAPDLKLELTGPSRRFLERQATYQLNIANTGTADATNIEISVQLDRGFTFVSTDFEGQYDPSRHAVFWSLAQLPAGGSGSVPLKLLPVEVGQQVIKIDAHADLDVVAKSERTMQVEGFAELSFAISNPGGPIELGAETTYEIHVTNSGSMPDSNVRVQLQLPAGLELVSADGEAGTDGKGLVAFQPKAQLAPGDDLKLGLRVKGTAAGTHIVRAIVVSDHSTVPVTKEESTLVYADQ